MKLTQNPRRLSANDLAKHLGCRHLPLFDRAAAHGKLEGPPWRDPALELLQQHGLIHERAYLDKLRGERLALSEPPSPDEEASFTVERAAIERPGQRHSGQRASRPTRPPRTPALQAGHRIASTRETPPAGAARTRRSRRRGLSHEKP